ncbi:MAG TPA: bifunctional helix-turn-helix transcriptional regulator/GNAT family N-acetyltransferase [Rubrobacteraceae bacterium]|jgi:DNA-binding MarR family transcriptional regulator/N-acetylglutamate synthase-like GNAT family acetyltransferase|nr:bifunctional helix-turn-helix transcriptional regulator/GNAT family N-acetyltransferase [Rubrobacteraceae bacterium]
MAKSEFDQRVGAVRRFNRFWTRRIGVLREGYLESPFSLTEVRVLYELARSEETTASELGKELGLDAGYLSRILRGFQGRGLISKKPSKTDGRRSLLRLTEEGQETFAPLDARSREDVGAMLGALSAAEQDRLIGAMRTVEELLGAQPEAKVPFLLRPHEPGDMGWVVHRHGILYAREYGWDERFEALVARIVADFVDNFDPAKERCWIAESDRAILGCVFIVKESDTVAKLRLLLVEPEARGLGLGTRLVEECVRFARSRGYEKLTLWTNSVLDAARHIYEEKGFEIVEEEEHHSFGKYLVGQNWELKL